MKQPTFQQSHCTELITENLSGLISAYISNKTNSCYISLTHLLVCLFFNKLGAVSQLRALPLFWFSALCTVAEPFVLRACLFLSSSTITAVKIRRKSTSLQLQVLSSWEQCHNWPYNKAAQDLHCFPHNIRKTSTSEVLVKAGKVPVRCQPLPLAFWSAAEGVLFLNPVLNPWGCS